MEHQIIDSKQGKLLDLKELWRYRDLFVVLAQRDLKVRYAQTFLGFAWALLQPLSTLLVFVLVFGLAVKVETGAVPYPLFALSGMSLWMYFASVFSQSGNAIVNAAGMINKIYFPRLIVPLSKAITPLVDAGVNLILLLLMMIWYGFTPGWQALWFPLVFVAGITAAMGIGLWVSALSIRYRDFLQLVPFMVQFGLYLTPVGYPSSLIPEKFRVFYFINPMAGVIEAGRWALLGEPMLNPLVWISVSVAVLLLISGLVYFKRVEHKIADLL